MTAKKNTRRLPQRHHLYRHYDGEGRLLYVGIAVDALKRLNQHYDTAEWYDEIVYVTIQRYSDRTDLEIAEKVAIEQESPLFNRTGSLRVKNARPKMVDLAHEVMTVFRDHDFKPLPVIVISMALGRFGERYYSFGGGHYEKGDESVRDGVITKMIELGYLERYDTTSNIEMISITDKGKEASDYYFYDGKQPVYIKHGGINGMDYWMTSLEDGVMGADISTLAEYCSDPDYETEYWVARKRIGIRCGKYTLKIESPSYWDKGEEYECFYDDDSGYWYRLEGSGSAVRPVLCKWQEGAGRLDDYSHTIAGV